MAANLGELVASTLRKYGTKNIADNVFYQTPVLAHLRGKGAPKGALKLVDGGRNFTLPIEYDKGTVSTFNGLSAITYTDDEIIDVAEYDWGQYVATAAIPYDTEKKNSGAAKILNIIKAKIRNMEKSLSDQLESDLFTGDGTNKHMVGLQTLVSTTGTVGGIDPTVHTFWQSYVDSTAGALTVAQMRTAMNTTQERGAKATLIVTTRTLHEKYEDLASDKMQIMSGTSKEANRLADLGFDTLVYKRVPLVSSTYVSDGEMYFLSFGEGKALQMGALKPAFFDLVSGEKGDRIPGALGVGHELVVMATLGVAKRRALAKLTGKTA